MLDPAGGADKESPDRNVWPATPILSNTVQWPQFGAGH
jgi:hypothetical protein